MMIHFLNNYNIKNPFNTKVECLNDCETIEESEFMIPQNLKNVVL